jgi:hypothetical protein
MTDFLKDCYFNGFCKGRKNYVPTPRYAKKLRSMPHSAEFLSATPRYAIQCEIQVKNFLVDSAICGIADFRRRISPRIRIYMQNRFCHESGDPGAQFNEKTEGRKSRETVPLKCFQI